MNEMGFLKKPEVTQNKKTTKKVGFLENPVSGQEIGPEIIIRRRNGVEKRIAAGTGEEIMMEKNAGNTVDAVSNNAIPDTESPEAKIIRRKLKEEFLAFQEKRRTTELEMQKNTFPKKAA